MKKIIKFIWDDFKTDFIFLWKLIKKDPELQEHLNRRKESLKREWEQTTLEDLILSIIKSYWIWYILIILAFTVGWFFAAQYYEQACNTFIFENYIKPQQILNGTFDNLSTLYNDVLMI